MTIDDGRPRQSVTGLPPEWNETATLFERDSTIYSVFQERVRETPEAVALDDGRRALTYRELDDRAGVFAERLRPFLDGADQCVGVLVPRSIDAVVAFLAVLRAGAAYVPLEVDLPVERLQFIALDTATRALITLEPYVGLAAQVSDRPTLLLDDVTAVGPSEASPDRPDAPIVVGPRSLAYVMYTSGTSGRPKGVSIEHRGVLRYVRGAHDIVPRPEDRVLHVGQLAFDASTYEIWGALCNGACLVVHSGERFEPKEVAGTIERHGITIGMFSTGALHLMISGELRSLGRYRVLIAAGDVLSPALARRLREAFPATRLVNAYGPTETTVTASVYDVTEVDVGRSVPIGRPLANTELYVLDEQGRPVEAGEIGELYAGGDGIARGYLGRPELTAEKFVPDVFGPNPQGRLYRTGDLVRVLTSGDLEFLGRVDDQVKVHGYRVEPAEIAAVLCGHPSVLVAEVLAHGEGAASGRLVAYVVADYDMSPDRLRRYLRHKLPEYMVPSEFVMLDEMPLTAIGKVDRAALSLLAPTRITVAPNTPTERVVARLWSEVFGGIEVSVRDDFFDSGGDSLMAMQLLALIRDETGVDLALATIFDERNVSGIARRVDELAVSASDLGRGGARLAPLEVNGADGSVPSITQAQACFLSDLAEEALPYQSNAVIGFFGRIDSGLIERSLQRIVDRHDVLRTTYPVADDRRVPRVHPTLAKFDDQRTAIVHPTFRVSLPIVDLRTEISPEQAFDALLADCVAERIELSDLPLVRWTLALITDDHARLVQVEHHVIHDGRSFANIVGEIVGTYRALLDHHPPAFPAPTLQYADFATWQRAFVESDAGRRQLEYWQRILTDPPAPPELATDRPAPLTRSFRGSSVRWELARELVDRIHRTAVRAGATPYMVMLAAFVTLLSRLSNETDVVVGSGLANRQVPGTETLLGMFVNTVVLRTDLSGDPFVDEIVAIVRTACLGAFENQELPFEEVVRALAPPRRAGHNPIYDHLFSFHDSPFPELSFDGMHVEVTDTISNGSAKADLNVVVINRRGQEADDDQPDGKELSIVWEFATDVFDEATAESLLAAYVTLLEQMTEGVERRMSELELVDDEQRGKMIDRAIAVTPYEDSATIDEVFADRVLETPDAVALEAGTSRLTYRELEVAAERLSHRLGALGVGRGVVVGVVDDRSRAMVVALLAILKRGGTYVGLDRTLPRARLQRIAAAARLHFACVGSTSTGQITLDDVVVVDVDVEQLLGPETTSEVDGRTTPTAGAASDVAYVSFTSGSTGEPKGVEVLHRGVVRLARTADYLDLGPTAAVLAASPLAFDASTFEVWGPLLNGGRLVLPSPGPLSTREIAEVMASGRVTTAWFSAGMFHQMVDHEIEALCRLRQVLAGGDVLSRVHVNRLLEVMEANAVLVNGYGPTEGTTFSCCHVMSRGDRVERSVPLGRPIANTSAVIVDDFGHLVPDGAAGELWIGGDGVALGYLGRPDLTAERFVENPFGGRLGDRLYRTGDLVRRSTAGLIEFLGRSDRQVKIRGFRVEPAEAEAALMDHPLVAQAYVQPVQNRRDDKQLVAYLVRAAPLVTADPGANVNSSVTTPSDGDLSGYLHASLPRYMVPDFFVWLDQIPLRANGKVDLDRLPAPHSTWFFDDPDGTGDSRGAIAARSISGASRLENTLVSIFQEVMGIRDIGLDDDFFDLGGHSLLAVELLAAIERSTGARVRLAAIFEAPTVAKMAELLRSDGWDASIGSLVPLTTTGGRPPLFAVTAGDGNVVGFGPLARRLGPDQPFYVLQPFGLDSSAPLHRSVESMARHYVREVRRIQPRGPYLLCGRCFGSLVAYEMARRIESEREDVALLVSIDSGGPLWQTRRLANGVEYDLVMHEARLRGAVDGVALGDVFVDRADADRFVTWLGETVTEHDGTAINRYVYAAYLARDDVRRAYPLEDAESPGHEGLFHWAWVSGPEEMGLQTAFLAPPTPEIRSARQLHRTRKPAQRPTLLDLSMGWLNFATRGSVASLAERRRDDVLRVAHENAARYRAGPLRASVVLVHASDEAVDHQRMQFSRWYGLEVGGIEHRVVAGTHSGMLREPTVGALADSIEKLIDVAIERQTGAARVD